MGNRPGSSRLKTHDNKRKHATNYYTHSAKIKTPSGYVNQRAYPSQLNGHFQYHDKVYADNYGQYNGNYLMSNTQNQFAMPSTHRHHHHHHHHTDTNTKSKSNSSRIIFYFYT